ncbi:MAG: hypothetical protein K9M57_11545, partial [Phycisphaerae bacterium]|nr:hypothetical protein [Phycisphaerae bacterium]
EFNPYGPANPNGLYYMDARSGSVVIRNCRIKGTLVINSGGQDIIIETSVYWKPAREDYPALVIDGTTGKLFVRTNQDLYESIINRDLSLPGEAGYGTKWTHYPNMIKGLIFSLTDLDFEGYSYIKGSVISMNEITLKDDATLEYDANILNIPPMQFRNFFLAPVRGSWRKVIP